MSLKTTAHAAILEVLQDQVFHQVTYSGAAMSLSDTEATADTVLLNTTGGKLSAGKAMGATSSRAGMSSWDWTAELKFSCEVDESELFQNFKMPSFDYEGSLISVSLSGTFEVRHPVRQGGHTGTDLTIGLTITTRR